MQQLAHEVFSFDEFRLDVTRGALLQGDTELRLRPKSFDVLHYLIKNQGRLIGKDELIDHVWQGMAVTDDSLVQCLKDIRRALGDNAQEIIKTVPRRGYIFDRPVDLNGGTAVYTETSGFHLVIEEAIAEHAEDVSPVAKSKSLTQRISQHKFLTAAAIALVLVAAGGASFGLYRYRARAVSPFTSVAFKRLTNEGKTKIAAISPDGKYFAFALGEGNGKNSLWVRQITTVNNVPIVAAATANYEGLNFSPDGNSIYYVKDGTLYETGSLGGVQRRLWDRVTGRFAISPDGKRIAFIRPGQGDGKGTRLVIVNSDGTGDEQVLVYRKPPETFAIGGGCSWSPDGETLVCGAGDNPYFGQQYPLAVRISDGKQTQLTSKRWHTIGKTAWVRDGSGFVMTALDNGDGGGQLWYVSYPDGNAVRIQSDSNDYMDVTLTTADDTLMAIQREVAPNVFSVELADTTMKSSQLTFATSGHRPVGSITPLSDGSVLYTSDAGNFRDLWIMDANGGNARPLTNDEAMESNATVSPDGRSVAFAVASDGIWRIDLDGGGRRQLTRYGMFPEFSSDGKWIYYTLPRDGWTLWKVAAEGGDPLRITEKSAIQPAVSPDGQWMAYVSGKVQADLKLIVAPIEGGEPIRTFELTRAHLNELHWLPDGKSIAYQSEQNGVISIVNQPLDGSAPQVLLTAPPESEGFSGWGFSSDGKRIFYATGPVHYDVVLFNLGK